MKKVININFQGQVIAIEETAYEILNKYIVSLKNYFSREEGGDEIVNDIENRIAELFGNRLKLGINCITDEDVEAIKNSIGRPEDFDTEYEESLKDETKTVDKDSKVNSSDGASTESRDESKTLNRNSKDKIIGGVCSGIAHYFKTDPVWIRMIFLVLFGFLFWVYIILWIVLKEKYLETNITKKLYRNPNDRYIGGVCGGIAAYFKIESWIPRLIFVLPLFINAFGIISVFPLSHLFGNNNFNWNINGGVVLLYIVLMVIIPEAKSVKQKLEMMGEDEYIKSIRDKVNDNLASSKSRTEDNISQNNIGLKAKNNDQTNDTSKMHASNMPPEPPVSEQVNNRHYNKIEKPGCLNLLLIIFKVLLFTTVGVMALVLLAVFGGVIVAGTQLVPLKSLFIDHGYETTLLIISLILIIFVPVAAIVIWIVRRVMKFKSRPIIGLIATILWFGGLTLGAILAVNVADKFRVDSSSELNINLTPTLSNKLYVEMDPYKEDYAEFKIGYGFRNEIDDLPYTNIDGDSLLFNDINMQIKQSVDSMFHVRLISVSKGKTLREAKEDVKEFSYKIVQNDSILLLPEFFKVPSSQGFRNQSVMVEISVPAGKSIEVSDALKEYRNNEPPIVIRKRIRAHSSSYTPYVPATIPEPEKSDNLI